MVKEPGEELLFAKDVSERGNGFMHQASLILTPHPQAAFLVCY